MSKDLYGALELPRGADSSEIRKQYLKLSRMYHPDKVSNEQKESAEAKFKSISEAYEILSDDEKKAYYDQTGQLPGEGGGGGPSFPFDINEMFGMFGGGRGQQRRGRRPGKAPSRKTQIPLTLKDFYYGRTLEIRLERQRFCSGCKGEGCVNTVSCNECNGQGVKRQVIQMGPMIMNNIGPCGKCVGSGKLRGDMCGGCSGSKFIKQDKALQLVIKKGMKPGDIITFSGESSHIEEFEEAGDVVVELQTADEESSWIREGSTLKFTSTITLSESLCGTKIVFMDHPGYIDGIVVNIPVGIQNKEVLVFNSLGMPIDEGRFGEFHLTILVKATKSEIEVLKNNSPYFQGLFTLPDISVENKQLFSANRIH
jgi:DnaJ family protein A protein 2